MNALRDTACPAATEVLELNEVAVGSTLSPETPSVEDVTWTVRSGDYWVIGGWPGSGKSDLLATIAGMMRPLRGTLRLFGLDRVSAHEHELADARAKIGLVFENGGRPFNHLTVTENVTLPLCYHENRAPEEAIERVGALLEFAGLESVAGRFPTEISFFLQQRMALVRALALRPRVLLVDNAVSGATTREARWWRQALSQLAAGHAVTDGQPLTLVVGCHDLRPWSDHGKQFALLKHRRWLGIGDRAALGQSEEPLLRELLAADSNEG
ncbi:MAG TPA: ATP-binding cassette domain-containing protein [Candidatus Nitrosotalea sp.]|nr:ATP-binding cassette domain-containing protein [Candidatus Nitrosotalea sp.]